VAAAVAVTAALVHVAIAEELTRASSFVDEVLRLRGRAREPLFAGMVALLAVVIPAAAAAGAFLARRPVLRLLPLGVSLVLLAGDDFPLGDDYPGVHGVVAWGAAMLGGAVLGPVVERAGRALVANRRGRIALGATGLFALLGLAVPPPNAVRYELFRLPSAIAPWVLASSLWRAPAPRGPVPPPPARPWFHDRAGDPPAPPSSPRVMPEGAVVVVITIDAVRADVVADPANDPVLPTFAELKRGGVYFTRASAPGTQTVLSLGTMFSGRYFSELLWTEHGEGRTRHLYPSDDPSIRFPEVLSTHGVATVNYAGLVFLSNAWGVARGFGEETVTVESWRHAQAHELIDPLLGRLQRAGPGPLFVYTHLMEPHEPYDRGRKDGTERERYLSEVAVADAQIGRVLRYLQQRFGKRWALFVSSDHGEAFGEHGYRQHGKSLYEELLHVPLLASSPLFTPRRIDDRVGLVDLGPTLLDLFGLETPPTFLGQSLVPFLTGGTVALTRPLVAEGRLRQALILPDGLKLIDDPRRKLVEAYDLLADPRETRNLFDLDPGRVDPALSALRAFFAAHTLTVGGYRPPYKP
jgi:hypothetical protein